jgi:hypothetical protein
MKLNSNFGQHYLKTMLPIIEMKTVEIVLGFDCDLCAAKGEQFLNTI